MLDRAAISARIALVPAPVRAAAMVLGAAVCFSCMITLIRYLSQSLHPFQVAFLRNLFGLAFMLPWIISTGIGGLRTRRFGLYIVRGLTGIAAMLAWFYGIATLPLDEAVALTFTTPMFTTVLAALVLKEVVRARRWTATIVGFGGALIILRPGFETISFTAILVLFSALMIAVSVILIKILLRTESINAVVTYMTLILAPLSLPTALYVWQWPTTEALFAAIALGGFATAAHLLFTRALALADASLIMPFDYARLPIVALIGYLVFDETPQVWTFVGAAVIAGAGIYIVRRELALRRTRHPPQTGGL